MLLSLLFWENSLMDLLAPGSIQTYQQRNVDLLCIRKSKEVGVPYVAWEGGWGPQVTGRSVNEGKGHDWLQPGDLDAPGQYSLGASTLDHSWEPWEVLPRGWTPYRIVTHCSGLRAKFQQETPARAKAS